VAGLFRRMAMPWMRVAHADGHAAAIPAAGAEWHGSVTCTRLVRPVDAFGQRLPVGSTIRSQVQPTGLSAHDEFRALAAGHRYGRAAQRVPASTIRRAGRARSGHPKSAIMFTSIFVGCSLIA
jgi:hypothetical protein